MMSSRVSGKELEYRISSCREERRGKKNNEKGSVVSLGLRRSRGKLLLLNIESYLEIQG